MAKLTLIKKLTNNEVINSFNLIISMLFGGKIPEIYDENKVYNKGDVVIVNENGMYKIVIISKDNVTGPWNPANGTEIVFTDLFNDSSILLQNNKVFHSKQEAISDDIATLLYELAGLIDNSLSLNTLYRENFRTSDNLKINAGMHIPGSIQAIPNHGIDFSLLNPVPLQLEPTSFKIKHFIEMMGVPTLGCSITFNALDSNPYWFNVNDAILNAGFINIPKNEFEKEDGIPYALDFRVTGSCPSNSSLIISDFMVVFI